MARQLARLAVLTLVAGVSLGCYAKYIGHYVIPREAKVDYSQAEERIYEAIRDLGFKRHKEYFLKSSEAVPLYARRFEGDDASVRVDVWEDPLDITLDDTSNRHETEFMREVKRRIEQCLRENYGLTDLEFRRHLQIGPNS